MRARSRERKIVKKKSINRLKVSELAVIYLGMCLRIGVMRSVLFGYVINAHFFCCASTSVFLFWCRFILSDIRIIGKISFGSLVWILITVYISVAQHVTTQYYKIAANINQSQWNVATVKRTKEPEKKKREREMKNSHSIRKQIHVSWIISKQHIQCIK